MPKKNITAMSLTPKEKSEIANGVRREQSWKLFMEKATAKYGDKYEYDRSSFVGYTKRMRIICPEHGEFWQTPCCHVNRKYGCHKCGLKASLSVSMKASDKARSTFVEKARKVHGDRYDYSKAEYKRTHEKVCIVCPEHGEFWQTPHCHLSGQKCPKCTIQHGGADTDRFIRLAKEVHRDRYDYSRTKYVNALTKVEIVCPKHGSFWQLPNSHVQGCGCPKCHRSHGELACANMLDEMGLKYEEQKTWPWLLSKKKRHMYCDFYRESLNLVIEVDGPQHRRQYKKFSGNASLENVNARDILKNEILGLHSINIIRIRYYGESVKLFSNRVKNAVCAYREKMSTSDSSSGSPCIHWSTSMKPSSLDQ